MKTKFIVILLLFAISCKKKEKEHVPADTQRPSIAFIVNGQTGTSGQHNVGDTVNFTFTITDNSDLASYTIIKILNSNTTTLQQSNISGASYQANLTYIVDTNITASTNIIIRCSATDESGNSSSNVSDAVYQISVVANGDILTITGQTIFSFQSKTGGFYSLSELQEHDSAFAYNNQGKIDLLFATNTPDTAFLSPDDQFAKTFFNTSAWSTRNNTLFKSTTMTLGTFNAITSSYGLNQLYHSFSISLGSSVGIKIGDVVAFETILGKKGFIYVRSINDISGQTIDNITFDVIIQK